MPHIAAAASAAIVAAAPAGVTAAVATTAATTAAKVGVMATLKTIAIKAATNFAISAALSALQPQVGAAGRPVEWTLDPDAPIPFAAGRVGVAGSIVHRDTFGPDLMYYGLVSVLSGSGPIDGFESFKGDDETVTFNGDGKAISSQWANEMWLRQSHGWQPDLAITSPPGLKNNAKLPSWTTAHKLSGKAAFMLVMGENSKRSAYPMGEVKPLHVIRGLKCWDPRLDSTYPGGSGSCRLGDPGTWVYSANPHIWAIKWGLGLWEGPTFKGAPAHGSSTDYQVGGIGAKLSGVDVTTLVAAANIADANSWTCAAYPTTDDDKSQVLDAFLQAGGAIYAQRAGKISCIQRAAPRTSIVTISAADTAGPIEIDTAASRIDRINTIRPKFWSEAHRWQLTALDDVTAEGYRVEDGETRPRALDFHYVTNARQASQLAALQIAHTREGIAGVIPLKPHLQRIKPGDAFTITEPGFVLNGVKCLCLNTEFDPTTKVVRVTFVSETDEKYAWALGLNPTPPSPPVLTPVDPTFVSPPEAGDWTVTPRPPATGGGQVPGFDLVGTVSNSTATAIIVEYGPTATGPWKQVYQGPPTVTDIPIDGLQPGATYFIAIQYQRNQNYSERHVYGPNVAPLLDPSPTGPTVVAMQEAIDLADVAINDPSTGLRARTDALWVDVKTSGTGLLARMLAAETAETTNNSAAVSRLNGLEASVNTSGTGLLSRATLLEGRMATVESGKASVERVGLIEAIVRTNPNLMANGNFERGNASLWDTGSVLAYAVNADLGGSVLYASPTTFRFYPRTPPANVWSGFASAFSAQADYQITGTEFSQACVIFYSDDASTTPLPSPNTQTPWRNLIINGTIQTFKEENFLKPAAARSARIVFSVGPSTRVVLRGKAKIEPGPIATAYTSEATSKEFFARQTEIDSVATEANGRSKAIKGVIQDVNGYVSGFASTNDGTTAMFEIRADAFAVRDPSLTGERFEIQGKRIRGWYASGQLAYQLG